jgi:hypothetical protein
MVTKSQEKRIEEAINMRLQLQKLGVLTDPKIAAKVKQHMNVFVSGDPQSSSFRLYLDGKSYVRVNLCDKEDIQSGIAVELSK